MSGLTGMPPPKKQDMFQAVIVDDAVAEHFPEGSILISAQSHGASFWTRTACIELELANKTQCRYFMKVATGDVGLGMLRGEYHGVSALYKFVPEGVPRPIAHGTYKADQNTHFYLCDFIDMIEGLPDIRKFCAMLAKLHHDSMVSEDAPTEFGFPVVTYEGNMYQDVTCFVDQERISQGPSKELDELLFPLIEKVIPRLLRPLQTHGRNIKPVLVHGEPLMFDPSVFWGHNEYDLDNMNIPRYRLGRNWMREYHKHFPISDPEDDYEDRNAVYAM
ncbi:hypothetical protein BDZ45DRAFT_700792 [Acephala macrosclerotiorum]|nr:hypothetical protein BDZ45DRAFT_700792 [Acephala macrosclerotiorum]